MTGNETEPIPQTGESVGDSAKPPRRWRRPASFWLLLAILAVVVLGVQIVYARDNPKQFAFYLSLLFVFFLVVIARALWDALEIARDHFRDREAVFRSTLGDSTFVRELGERVHSKQDPK